MTDESLIKFVNSGFAASKLPTDAVGLPVKPELLKWVFNK